MKPQFHPGARAEMEQSAEWYESRKPGLGGDFLTEVEETLARDGRHPAKWREIEPGVRYCHMDRFPFAVIYRVRQDSVQVVAISHHRRRPGYWKGRL